MICMTARTILNFGLIGPPTAELAALEHPHRLIMGKLSAVVERILIILAGNDNIQESLDEFEIWLDPNTSFHGNR